MSEQQSQQGFEGYGGTMELTLHGGRVVTCRAPTMVETGKILALRRRVIVPPGDDDAFLELLTLFPTALGLKETFDRTPMLPSEFLDVVTHFFGCPSRQLFTPTPAAGNGSSPAGTIS